MPGVNHYTELIAWQKGMELVREVYYLTKAWPREELFGLTSQLRRSAISVPSNIAEGFGRKSNRELLRFLQIANGSLMECETQIRIAAELGYIEDGKLSESIAQTSELSRILNKFISSLAAHG